MRWDVRRERCYRFESAGVRVLASDSRRLRDSCARSVVIDLNPEGLGFQHQIPEDFGLRGGMSPAVALAAVLADLKALRWAMRLPRERERKYELYARARFCSVPLYPQICTGRCPFVHETILSWQRQS